MNHETLSQALRLLVGRLEGNVEALVAVEREVGDDRRGWLDVTLRLVSLHWEQVLQRFGVDTEDSDADWPQDAYTLLESDLAAEQDPTRRRALRLTLCLADRDRRGEEVQGLVDQEPDLRPLAAALVDLTLDQPARQAHTVLLGEYLGALADLLPAQNGGNP